MFVCKRCMSLGVASAYIQHVCRDTLLLSTVALPCTYDFSMLVMCM